MTDAEWMYFMPKIAFFRVTLDTTIVDVHLVAFDR